MHCISVELLLDRCGMGEILDCLQKIKLDINSLKTRVEELSDNQTRSINKTETDKKENDKMIKTLTRKIDSVKHIVEPITDEYILNRSAMNTNKYILSSLSLIIILLMLCLRSGSSSPKKRKDDCLLSSSKKSSCSETDGGVTPDSLSNGSSLSSLVLKGEKRAATKKRNTSPRKKTSKLDPSLLNTMEPASSNSDLFDF